MPSGANPGSCTSTTSSDIAVPDVHFRPIRRALGITGFGINGYTADAGERVIEEHDETGAGAGGHEELYLVLAGAARFELDGREIDAPAGSLVFVPDPATRRGAVATAAGTTVVVIGGRPVPACRRRRSSTGSWPSRRTAAGRYEEAERDRAGRASRSTRATPSCTTSWRVTRRSTAGLDTAMEHLRAALAGDPTLSRYARGRRRSRRAPRPPRLAGLRRGLRGVSLVPCRSRCRRVSSTS